MTAGRVVPLADGYPQLCRDVTRSLARGARRLAEDQAVITFDRDPGAIAAQHGEITAAWKDRNRDARRAADEDRWRAGWDRAGELATLRIGGQLAAWLLARTAGDVYEVIAAQMAGDFRRHCPGLVLEGVTTARAMAGPEPWPPLPDVIEAILKAAELRLAGGGHAAHRLLDWGPGYPGKLLTR